MPVLTITAERDDLASPESTHVLLDVISSKDKDSIRMPGGHVGLCIGGKAHETLWPRVAKWLLGG